MKSQKGEIVLYVAVACLFILAVGLVIYLVQANEQATKLAELKKMEEQNNNIELQVSDTTKEDTSTEMVPVYTPQQFSLVGSGQEVYIEEEAKFYTFSADKTYIFYGVKEDLKAEIKEQLAEQLKTEIIVELNEKGVTVSAAKVQEPEAPRLASNMVAVYWSKDGGITASTHEEGATPIYSKIDANGNPSSTGTANPSFRAENWYEYRAGYNQIDTKTSRWANGVTDDGSWWVWIPRFKYKITDKPGVTDTASAGIVDVKFISISETSGTSTYTTKKNDDGEFITRDEEGYIIHPAFEDGSTNGAKAQGHSDYVEYNNGEWDSELAGFWVAKYEMSMEDGSGNAVEPSSDTTGNVEISNIVKMVSKANRGSWRYVSIGIKYKNCYNYNRTNNSHMIKDSEWGAMVYLTHSQYGRNGNEVTKNATNYITAYMGEIGSTTGNIYGIYDTVGGSWEDTATWNFKTTTEHLINYGNIIIDNYMFGIEGATSHKYATVYKNEYSSTGNHIKKVCKTGDGIKEVFIMNNLSWFNDRANITNYSYPFQGRGGGYITNNIEAGIFSSTNYNGIAVDDASTRVILNGNTILANEV